jgi:hypothetical protein
MDKLWNQVLRSQFTAAINMLEQPIRACPDELWNAALWHDPNAPPGFSDFWYVAYHAMFWLDLYLYGKEAGFTPPAPFDLNELEPQGVLPAHKPEKDELLWYLDLCRKKCYSITDSLDDEKLHQSCEFPWSKGGLSYAELLLDNLRHVQEHAAQLNMFLGQKAEVGSRWVGRVKLDQI